MTEVEYHYFAILNEVMDQSNDDQWLLKSFAEKSMGNFTKAGWFRQMTHEHVHQCRHNKQRDSQALCAST